MAEIQDRLNRLVSAYIDQEIPKESYLAKNEELLKQKLAFTQNLESFGQKELSWIKPLRQWIFDAKKATLVASSDNLSDMGQIIRKVGLNPTFLYKTIKMPFTPPWSLTAEILTQSYLAPVQNAKKSGGGSEKNLESFFWCLYIT